MVVGIVIQACVGRRRGGRECDLGELVGVGDIEGWRLRWISS